MSDFPGRVSLGVDLTRADSTQKFTLGQRVEAADGNEYVYVKAGGAIAANKIVALASGFVATALSGVGTVFGVAKTVLALNEFGWVQVRGQATASIATSTAAAARLSRVTNGSGQLKAVSAVDEGSTGTYVSGELAVVGQAFTAESSNLATVYLY